MAGTLPTDVYVIIEGEPFLSRAKDFKARSIAAKSAWRQYLCEIGAEQGYGHNELASVVFPRGKVPTGWTARDRKGRSRPKKGSEAEKKLAALPTLPQGREVFGDAIVEDLRYESDGGHGMGAIGQNFWGPFVGWMSDVFFGIVPHAGNAAKNHLAEYPKDRIIGPAKGWTVPDGLREITKAEYELMLAEHNVKMEREKSAVAKAA